MKVNNIEYNVGTAAIKRSLRTEEKYRVVTEDGRIHREVRSKYVDFSLELGNLSKADYDSLMAAIMAAQTDVTIALPSTATGISTYTGAFDGVSDEVITDDGTQVTWDRLCLEFTGTVPMEVSAD